jgi:hypothetical protein
MSRIAAPLPVYPTGPVTGGYDTSNEVVAMTLVVLDIWNYCRFDKIDGKFFGSSCRAFHIGSQIFTADHAYPYFTCEFTAWLLCC